MAQQEREPSFGPEQLTGRLEIEPKGFRSESAFLHSARSLVKCRDDENSNAT